MPSLSYAITAGRSSPIYFEDGPGRRSAAKLLGKAFPRRTPLSVALVEWSKRNGTCGQYRSDCFTAAAVKSGSRLPVRIEAYRF
jgi:hypothetical protein